MASRTPGDLGVYGFRNRSDHTYDGRFIADGSAIKAPRLWDSWGGRAARRSSSACPAPTRRDRCAACSSRASSRRRSRAVHVPAGLHAEVAEVVGEYMFDVKDFRTEDKDGLLRAGLRDDRPALRPGRHLLATRPWELFVMVEMGTDRIHHGFWKYMDAQHRKHEPGNPFEPAILDYYRHVDGLMAGCSSTPTTRRRARRLRPRREAAGRRDARSTSGCASEGLLALQAEPSGVTCRTRSGSTGRGRPPGGRRLLRARLPQRRGTGARGAVAAGRLRGVRDELDRSGSRRSPTTRATPMATRVYKPEELYDEVNGVAPT